jgi:hypothetical protein
MIIQNLAKFFLVIVCCLLPGCEDQVSSPETFQLGVQDVICEDMVHVAVLTVHTSFAGKAGMQKVGSVSFGTDESHIRTFLTAERDGGVGDVRIDAVCCLGASGGTCPSFTLFEMKNKIDGLTALSGGPMTGPITNASKVSDFFKLSATSGNYRIGSPVPIGELCGKPITLLVSRSTPESNSTK